MFPFGELAEYEDSKRTPLNKQDREARKSPCPYYGATSIMGFVNDYLFDDIRVLLGEDGGVMTDRTVISRIVTGAVQKKISQKKLNNLVLQMPNQATIPDFESIFAMYRSNIDEITRLAELRDALPPN